MMVSDWDDALGAELEGSGLLSDEIEACEESTCESEDSADMRPSVWWSAVLMKAAENIGLVDDDAQTPSQAAKVHVVSGCTGGCAEAWAFKAWAFLLRISCSASCCRIVGVRLSTVFADSVAAV